MDRSIFAVVGDGPDAGGCLDKSLIAVVVKLWCEFSRRERRVAEVGNLRILIEVVRDVCAVRAKVKR